jgi:hypothetical protein
MNVAYRLSWVLAFLMAGQSLAGLFLQSRYHDADWIEAAWFANDWLTAVVALPLLASGVIRAHAGSDRGTLLWLGVVSYAVYNYAYYLFGAALNVFFPAYIAAFVISILILILALPQLEVGEIAGDFKSRWSARVAAGFFTLTGIGLIAAWITMWGAYVFDGRATPVPPEAFKLVAALDLSLMAPWGLHAYPVQIDNPFLALIAHQKPFVFGVLSYGYSALWLSSTFFAVSLVTSVAAIVASRFPDRVRPQALPQYPDGAHCCSASERKYSSPPATNSPRASPRICADEPTA